MSVIVTPFSQSSKINSIDPDSLIVDKHPFHFHYSGLPSFMPTSGGLREGEKITFYLKKKKWTDV